MIVTTITFIQGMQEHSTPTVIYQANLIDSKAAGLLQELKKSDKLKLLPESTLSKSSSTYDALLSYSKSKSGQTLEVEYHKDRQSSIEALERIKEITNSYSLSRHKAWLSDHNLPSQLAHPFEIEVKTTASSGEVGGYILGALLPAGLLIMIALGGAYPAVDTIAGERERGTWETLQSCAPSTTTIILSKYLFVCILCCLSGLLNMLAMLISIRSIVAPIIRSESDISFNIGISSLIVLVSGIVLVSFFIGAALLLCAVFARTFREGQALITPFFMLITLPMLALSDPNLQITNKLALIPLVNLALVWRQALLGHFTPYHLAATFISILLLIWLCLYLGSKALTSEALMSGRALNTGLKGLLEAFK